jgi:hypothetical protein
MAVKCFNCGKNTKDYRYIHLVRFEGKPEGPGRTAGYKVLCNQHCKDVKEITLTIREEEYREEEEEEEEEW